MHGEVVLWTQFQQGYTPTANMPDRERERGEERTTGQSLADHATTMFVYRHRQIIKSLATTSLPTYLITPFGLA